MVAIPHYTRCSPPPSPTISPTIFGPRTSTQQVGIPLGRAAYKLGIDSPMMLALLLGALHCASGLAPIARTSPLLDGCPRAVSPLSASSSSLPPSFARRSIFTLVTAASLGAFMPAAAEASGGATAGKYTTIPIAKRRYFGRVKQGVYEFTLLGDAVKKVRICRPILAVCQGAAQSFRCATLAGRPQERGCVRVFCSDDQDAVCAAEEPMCWRCL